jgi:hypothetical protein
MADHAAFSDSKRRKGALKTPAGSRGFSAAAGFGGKRFPANNKVPVWETAFHAERGCLSVANMPRQAAPGMSH